MKLHYNFIILQIETFTLNTSFLTNDIELRDNLFSKNGTFEKRHATPNYLGSWFCEICKNSSNARLFDFIF